ncbi:MAG: putative HNHc nuclease [Cetobacterium sp.]|uniref:putative HNHc nuclease n=1 Tax=Cetobacterium sp. TaxID=2071632 RepID=UPI002FC8927B
MHELVTDTDNNICILKVSDNLKPEQLNRLKKFLQNCNWIIKPVPTLSLEQMKLAHILLKELGELIGYTGQEMRVLLQNEFCKLREIEYFSLSPNKTNAASKEIATDFITYIIEWAILNNYNLILHEGYGERRTLRSVRDVVPDIRRHVLACLLAKACAVCGTYHNVELHHYDSVNSIGGYEHCDGLKTRFMSLCREHHSLYHSIEQKEFESKFHLEGVWLNPNLVIKLKEKYPNHFQAFDEKKYKVEGQ